jgi:ankyrin repeat protein
MVVQNQVKKLVPETKIEVAKDSCRICLTEFEPKNPDEKINKLKCSHIFHEPCINEWYSKSGNIICPLCRSVNAEIIEAFIAAVDNNEVVKLTQILEKNRSLANYMIDPKEQNTILHYAAAKGLRPSVKVLLAFKANPRARNLLWEIPLHLAAAHGHIATASKLCSRHNVNTRDQVGNTPLHRAATGGWVKTMQMLIARGADKNSQTDFTKYTPLHCGVIQKRYLAVQELLQQNADPSLCDWQDKTPHNYAVLYGRSRIAILLIKYRLAGF